MTFGQSLNVAMSDQTGFLCGLFRSWRRLIHRPPYPHVQQHFLLNVAKSCKGKLSNWAHRQNFSSLDPDQKLFIDGRVGGLWRGQARGKQWQRVGALSLVCPQTQLWRRRENVSESLGVMPLSFFSPIHHQVKHRKNCECCPDHSLTVIFNVMIWVSQFVMNSQLRHFHIVVSKVPFWVIWKYGKRLN